VSSIPPADSEHRSSLVQNNRPKSASQSLSVCDLESSSLAGYFRFIRSNLCTCHIPNKLTPHGHHDWPDKSASVYQNQVKLTYHGATGDWDKHKNQQFSVSGCPTRCFQPQFPGPTVGLG
jgi:hypothetical protein